MTTETMTGPIRPVLAPLIAVVGADGSGKSSLVATLVDLIGPYQPVSHAYLGQGSGDLGRRIGGWPIIGPALQHFLEGRATHLRERKGRPTLLTAYVGYRFSMKRVNRFRQLLAERLAGRIVITDRYPQVDVPNWHDGPVLTGIRRPKGWAAYLMTREQRLYDWMSAYRPDCVIRLHVSLEQALARKPDHPAELIRRKIEMIGRLRFNGAPIVEIDADGAPEQVLACVWTQIRPVLDARGYTIPEHPILPAS